MSDNVKKYKKMEGVLNNIQRRFISLADEDRKRSIRILQPLVYLIISTMKRIDSLFKAMYQRLFFGGSYYDGLRVCKPNEFDLDLLMKLPKFVKPQVETSKVPGHVHVNFTAYKQLMRQAELGQKYNGIYELMDENDTANYLDTSKVLSWMEKVVTLALNEFEKEDDQFTLTAAGTDFYVKVRKGGPAFTLEVNSNIDGDSTSLDIDLVPCFVFGKKEWPVSGYRKNPVKKRPGFFVVPKPLKEEIEYNTHYWRLSFQEQERLIIDEKQTLKPTLRLLKKLRDSRNHKFISSYYLKTIMLWQTDERDAEFWNKPLSYVFMTVLKRYYIYLCEENIPYYWCEDNNLLKYVKSETIRNTRNNIKRIIRNVEDNLEDSNFIAKYLLSSRELTEFKNEMSSDDERSCRLNRI